MIEAEGEQQPASIQVRTVLQHAWAEFEHDIRYKGTMPDEHARDFAAPPDGSLPAAGGGDPF